VFRFPRFRSTTSELSRLMIAAEVGPSLLTGKVNTCHKSSLKSLLETGRPLKAWAR